MQPPPNGPPELRRAVIVRADRSEPRLEAFSDATEFMQGAAHHFDDTIITGNE